MLTDQKLMNAMIECRRFMKAAGKARNKLIKEPLHPGGQETASAKRASMDLTRALSKLRGRG